MQADLEYHLKNLIILGDPDTASHGFVRDVAQCRTSIAERLAIASKGALTSVEKGIPALKSVLWHGGISGIGYLASSVHHDRDREVLWAAAVMEAFYLNDTTDWHPLIIPIDAFYSFVPGATSLVAKTQLFSSQMQRHQREALRDEQGHPYALILSGFSESRIFTEDTLLSVPHQREIGLCEGGNPFTKCTERLDKFASYDVGGLFKKHATVEGVMASIGKHAHDSSDTRLLLAASLLLADRQTWQSLSYELHEGVPLYIVAPASFHDAMNRLNYSWGHGMRDYQYRSGMSLGAGNVPLIENVGDSLCVSQDDVRAHDFFSDGAHFARGLRQREFESRVGYLLEALMDHR